jgi:hypothetical protein
MTFRLRQRRRFAWLATAVVLLVSVGSVRAIPARESQSPNVQSVANASALSPSHIPNSVVVPPYRARIRAAHRLHAEKTKTACLDCHPKAKTSERAEDWLGPVASSCDNCHKLDHRTLSQSGLADDPQCRICHLTALGRNPSTHLRNSHAGHAKRNIGCPQCHGRVEHRPDAIGSERLPTKPSCVRCHAGRGQLDGDARADCTLCHESEGGRMRTRFQGQLLQPSPQTPSLEHGNDWLYRHRDVAGNDPSRCSGCHAIRECQGCHDGRLRPRNIHPSDWLSAHAVAAKQDGLSCNSCHRQQTFCLSCHQRLGLGSSGAPVNMASRGALHPPASVWTTGPVGPQHHATQARRNLSQCVSCHQERDCVRCHATGAVGGPGIGSPFGSQLNPHPPGFAASCSSYWSQNPRPCLVCHRPDGPELLRCR